MKQVQVSIDGAGIPQKFWEEMSPPEFDRFRTRCGQLDAEQCARLWRMTGRKGPPPDRLVVMFSTQFADRLVAQDRKKKSRQ